MFVFSLVFLGTAEVARRWRKRPPNRRTGEAGTPRRPVSGVWPEWLVDDADNLTWFESGNFVRPTGHGWPGVHVLKDGQEVRALAVRSSVPDWKIKINLKSFLDIYKFS